VNKSLESTDSRERVGFDQCTCLQLLARENIGHLGLSARALPVVKPIRYRLNGRAIVFATTSESEYKAARQRVVACVGVAGTEASTGAEWSVLATGRLRDIGDPAMSLPDHGLVPPPWGAAEPTHFVALDIELLSGCPVCG
jgi:nitroimidazol reductase NimA-like FMN-containing flavoprotein (pyridoxamine 5'-phosphate oxidase superfamily)